MSQPDEPEVEPSTVEEGAPDPREDFIRQAREEDVQTQRTIIRFIVAVTLGFIVATVVMSLGAALGQMWLFYTGMGIAVLCMSLILMSL